LLKACELAVDAVCVNDRTGQTVFAIQIPINPVVRFVQRNAFARDKVTGDNDGKAEPGEQIEMRVRLKTEGQLVGKNVVVTLSTSDPNVTIPSPTVTHANWPAGVARNNHRSSR
jgi:hypothetical protein